MGPLEAFVGWTIKCELTNMTLNFSQSELICKNDSSIQQRREIDYNIQQPLLHHTIKLYVKNKQNCFVTVYKYTGVV